MSTLKDLAQIIATIGFPIVMSLLFWYHIDHTEKHEADIMQCLVKELIKLRETAEIVWLGRHSGHPTSPHYGDE